MAWFIVVVAGLLETGFAISLKQSHGFTRITPTVLFMIFALTSFGLLTLALKRLEVGSAYAVWTGIGAVGAFVVGILAFGDQASAMRLVSIGLIVAGIVGLKLA